jgi:hypothetical protein
MRPDSADVTIMFFSVMILLILFTTGCTENLKQNSGEHQVILPDSTGTINSPLVSTTATPIQDLTISSPDTITATVTPHFTGTILHGSNRSSALTEEQAWKIAEPYLRNHGLPNIQASEVIFSNQSTWVVNDTQLTIWGFEVRRIKNGINVGGVIIIDAYDGHIVSFTGFD